MPDLIDTFNDSIKILVTVAVFAFCIFYIIITVKKPDMSLEAKEYSAFGVAILADLATLIILNKLHQLHTPSKERLT